MRSARRDSFAFPEHIMETCLDVKYGMRIFNQVYGFGMVRKLGN